MTTHTPSGTTSGLPTARGYLPAGTPGHLCVDHNRACKVLRTTVKALHAGYDEHILDEEIGLMAEAAGVNEPNSDATRAAVRSALRPPLSRTSSDRDLAAHVKDAAELGLPFRYRTADGRMYVIAALPTAE